MVDVKDDMMNNDAEAYDGANSADPKNVQELTQYVSNYVILVWVNEGLDIQANNYS